jgi:hypothetical protein
MKVYIPTYDDNNFFLKYFQYFFNKYWSDNIPVIFLGFKKPEMKFENNFTFVSLAEKREGGVDNWSTYLIDFFSSIEDEYFIFGLDDFLVVREVNLKLFNACTEIMGDTIGRIDLQPLQHARKEKHFSNYTLHKDIQFIKLAQQGDNGENLYRLSCAYSIWNKKWFLKTLEPNWSPWDWEIKGNDGRHDNDGYEVVSTKDQWCIKKTEGLSSRWAGKINVKAIREEDKINMQKMTSPHDRITTFFDNNEIQYAPFGAQWVEKIYGE